MSGPTARSRTLNDRQITFGPDGEFEVVVSADERSGNWVRMEPDVCSVIVRQYFEHPPAERVPATLAIEVLDGPARRRRRRRPRRLPHRAIGCRRRPRSSAAPTPRSRSRAGPLENAFSDPLGYSGEAGALGTTDNVYVMGRWRLGPGSRS